MCRSRTRMLIVSMCLVPVGGLIGSMSALALPNDEESGLEFRREKGVQLAPVEPDALEMMKRGIPNLEGSTGVLVQLGCEDVPRNLVGRISHYLDIDPDKVSRTRDWLRWSTGYGPKSAIVFDGTQLPYADNLVNVLVVANSFNVSQDEMMRVIAPGGLLILKQRDPLEVVRKPRPPNIDEWTHYLHDATGNPVAHDDVVGPPGKLQWIADPKYTRSHEYIPSIYSVVSSNGRIFYIQDKAPVADIRKPSEWSLVARDAFNGVLLWEIPLPSWYPHLINWGHTPTKLQRKLVAVDDRVYVTLGLHAPLTEIDAKTGEAIKVFDQTTGTDEIIFHDGVLLLVVREVTNERVQQLLEWGEMIQRGDTRLATRDAAEPLIRRLRAAENSTPPVILAIGAESGKQLWRRDGMGKFGVRPDSLCAAGDRVFFQSAGKAMCVDLGTGRELWAQRSEPLRCVAGDRVVTAGKTSIAMRSVEDGEVVWEQKPSVTNIHDVFVTKDALWVGGFKPIEGKRGPSWGPYFASQRDLNSGELLMHVEPENPGHHHRCYKNKATDRFILGGRRGTEFIDLETGDLAWNSWVRGVCRYGVMPCNGLLYAPPHACACFMTVKTTGFYALAPRSGEKTPDRSEAGILEKGAAYKAIESAAETDAGDWPTFRGDAARSGSTACNVASPLSKKWSSDCGEQLSCPVIGNGVLLVADTENHRVIALDAETGESRWEFTSGARIDSPPTIHAGRAVFGCRDGSLYSLRVTDGQLDWKLPIRVQSRFIAVRGQLESVAPMSGSVLIRDRIGYVVSGHNSYLDQGVDLVRFDPMTGEVLSQTKLFAPDPATGKSPDQIGPNAMPGAKNDILSSDDGFVYLRDIVFGSDGSLQEKGNAHLLTLTGFRDDAWSHRSFWIYGSKVSVSSGCSGRDRYVIAGRLLVFDESRVFGYGRKKVHWSSQLEDGAYQLFCRPKADRKPTWETEIPVLVRAMVLAGDTLFVAGPLRNNGVTDPAVQTGDKSVVVAVSAENGGIQGQSSLPGLPAFDGMAAAGGKLYVVTTDGQLVCMGNNGGN